MAGGGFSTVNCGDATAAFPAKITIHVILVSPPSVVSSSDMTSASLSVPLYLSETAPLMVTIGILVANLINYGTARIHGGWDWRVSLGLAAVPAIMIVIGSPFHQDTPNSLIQRGHHDKAKAMLRRVRGTENVQAEYDDLVAPAKLRKP